MKEGLIVAKFGGSSTANAESIRGVAEIVKADSRRRFVVVSAPGEDEKEKIKVTDLLISKDLVNVRRRFEDIGGGLNIAHLNDWLCEVEAGSEINDIEWRKSRGEWLTAKVFSQFMGGIFVDAEKLISLKSEDEIDPITYTTIKEQLSEEALYVIPGFYGRNSSTGGIICLIRDGSDLTGAIVAAGVGASLYENWTNVDGVRSVDPRIVADAKGIGEITYGEMRELAYRGTKVLQMDSVVPVLKAGIPIQVRNTFNPDHPGTMIVGERVSLDDEQMIGLASRKDFVSFHTEFTGMNRRFVVERMMHIFADLGVLHDFSTMGVDGISVICHSDQLLEGKDSAIMRRIQEEFDPDKLLLQEHIGIISVVGQQIKTKPTEINAKMYSALLAADIKANAGIHDTQGVSTIIAVDDSDVERTLEVLYNTFIR